MPMTYNNLQTCLSDYLNLEPNGRNQNQGKQSKLKDKILGLLSGSMSSQYHLHQLHNVHTNIDFVIISLKE